MVIDEKNINLFITYRNSFQFEKNKIRYFKEISIYNSDVNKNAKNGYDNRIVITVKFEVTAKGTIKNCEKYRKDVTTICFNDYKNDSFYISKDEIKSIEKFFNDKIKNTNFEVNDEKYCYFKETKKNVNLDLKKYFNYNNTTLNFIFLERA